MVFKYYSVYCHSDYMSKILAFSGGMFFIYNRVQAFNSSCPGAQNIKLLWYSQSKNRLHVHRNPLHFVTSIVGARNREGKF